MAWFLARPHSTRVSAIALPFHCRVDVRQLRRGYLTRIRFQRPRQTSVRPVSVTAQEAFRRYGPDTPPLLSGEQANPPGYHAIQSAPPKYAWIFVFARKKNGSSVAIII